jgi:hypothetical protein
VLAYKRVACYILIGCVDHVCHFQLNSGPAGLAATCLFSFTLEAAMLYCLQLARIIEAGVDDIISNGGLTAVVQTYGHTGSKKTYTMCGSPSGAEPGIIALALRDVLQHLMRFRESPNHFAPSGPARPLLLLLCIMLMCTCQHWYRLTSNPADTGHHHVAGIHNAMALCV